MFIAYVDKVKIFKVSHVIWTKLVSETVICGKIVMYRKFVVEHIFAGKSRNKILSMAVFH